MKSEAIRRNWPKRRATNGRSATFLRVRSAASGVASHLQSASHALLSKKIAF
jgi:hypothetical protein